MHHAGGGQITTSTFGGGAGGNLSVTVREATELVGSGRLTTGTTSSGLTTQTTGASDAGSLRLETGQLSVEEGALINASTSGSGAAGDVEVVADTIDVLGVREDQLVFSAIQSTSGQTLEGVAATGAAGDVSVESRQLSVSGGGQITTSTFGGGAGGNLSVTVREATELVGSGRLTTGTTSSGLTTQTTGASDAGSLRLETGQLSVEEGALINASTSGSGAAGDVEVVADTIDVSGVRGDGLGFSAIQSISGQTLEGAPAGVAGDVSVESRQLSVSDGGRITTETAGGGAGGNLSVTVREATELVGSGRLTTGTTSSGLTTQTTGASDAGSLRLETGQLSIQEGATINASTFGSGTAGDIEIFADSVALLGVREDQLFSSSIQSQSGQASDSIPVASDVGASGDILITARRLNIEDGGFITTQTIGEALAGGIEVNVQDRLEMNDGEISTISLQAAGGDIQINTAEGFGSGVVVLRGDSDITTSSEKDGGSIEIRGNAIIAFDDSDILTTSDKQEGGDIALDSFFSERDPFNTASPYDDNGRVDVNAEGGTASGVISTPNVSFIENNLNELSSEIVEIDALTAGSCVARDSDGTGSFLITGEEGLPQQPGSSTIPAYPTGTIQTVSRVTNVLTIQEPQNVYQMADGRLVLSYECES